MTLSKFLVVLVDSAFDRIDSTVPPCVTSEEAVEKDMVGYRWGVTETMGATLQTLCGTKDCWAMVDLMTASGLDKMVANFVQARINGLHVPMPTRKEIEDAIDKLKTEKIIGGILTDLE